MNVHVERAIGLGAFNRSTISVRSPPRIDNNYSANPGLFRLSRPAGNFSQHPLRHGATSLAEWLTGLREVRDLYDKIPRDQQGAAFIDAALGQLKIRYAQFGANLHDIPSSGPLVVVANHPFGGVDGLIASQLLLSVRSDVKLLGNELLGHIPQLRPLLAPVDLVSNRNQPVVSNSRRLRQSIRWLQHGHVLIVFPAGDVSYFRGPRLGVTDPVWQDMIGRLVHHGNADIVPIYFDGFNSIAFQLLGLIHPVIRSAMIVRELINKRNKLLRVVVGQPIGTQSLKSWVDHRDLTDYLRQHTYALRVELKSAAVKRGNRDSLQPPVS